MSWASVLADGFGKVEFRAAAEGHGYEFVTAPQMEQTVLGRERIAGLMRESIELVEAVDIAHAEVDAAGMTMQIVDRQIDEAVTKALAWRPTVVNYLDADLTRTATTVTLLSNAGITAGDVIHIGTEAILVGATSGGTDLTGCTRAYWGSIAQAHYANVDASSAGQIVTLARPLTLEGRRVNLYAYGEGDDPLGDGTLVWRGIAITDARLSSEGGVWQLIVDPLWSLFTQDMGADLDDPVGPRGIYYHSHNPLIVFLGEAAGASAVLGAPTASTTLRIPEDTGTAWFASNDELCTHINANLDHTGLNNVYRAVPLGDSDWYLQVTIDNVAARWPIFGFISRCDDGNGNAFHRRLVIGVDGSPFPVTVTGDEVYRTLPQGEVAGARGVPRGYWSKNSADGYGRVGYAESSSTAPDEVTYPPHRIYLGGALSVDSLDGVELGFDSGRDVVRSVDDSNVANRYIETDRWRARGSEGDRDPDNLQFVYTPALPLQIRARRFYALGDLDDFRLALISTTDGSPVFANQGSMPFVTSEDVEDWQPVVDAAHGGRYWAAVRSYVAYESVELSEFLAMECRLLGVYPRLGSDGKVGLERLRLPVATETPDFTITANDIFIDEGFPSWERNALGSLNTLRVKTGYNAREGKHEGATYLARDFVAYALRKRPRVLEVEPTSEPGPELVGVPVGEVVDLARPVLGIFGGDYAIVTLEVPLKFFAQLLGQVCQFTASNIPDVATGQRGVTNKAGILIGRRWEPSRGRGTFSILVSNLNIAGYTPSTWIDAAVDNGGNEWTFDLNTTDPTGAVQWYATGDAPQDHIAAGDEVVVYRWDNATPTEVAGSVVSIDAANVTIQFDGVFVSSALDVMRYDVAGQAEASQQAYLFLAGADALVDFPTAAAARVWAP